MEKAQTNLNIILLGPPGCGKGTQSPHIKDKMGLTHVATGDLLRAAIAAETELGKQIKELMASGGLVDDNLVICLVEE